MHVGMSFLYKYGYNKNMPYTLTHASVAYMIGQRFDCFTDRESLSQYMLGALGPDVFFYDRLPPTPFVPNQKSTGNLLHHVPCDRLVRILLTEGTDNLLPFIYGFLTHIALDSTLHPYINAKYSGLDHTRFEGQIDSILYRRFKDSIPFPDLFSKPAALPDLDALISRLCLQATNRNIPGAYARSAVKMLRLLPILFDPGGKRYRIVLKLEHLLGADHVLSGFLLAAERFPFEDCMNDRHAVWYAALFPDVPRTESVDDLLSDASHLAESLILSVQSDDQAEIERLCKKRTMSDGPIP